MKKGGYIIFFSIFLSLIICIAFYFTFHIPNRNELNYVSNKINNLETEINNLEGTIGKQKKEIRDLDLCGVNLNYFQYNLVQRKDKIAFFLKIINEHANKLGIQVISIIPRVPEQKKGYLKETYEINLKAEFQRLMAFINELQNTLGLNIDSLNITADQDMHQPEISILINTLEINDPKTKNIKTLEEFRSFDFKHDPALKDSKIALREDTACKTAYLKYKNIKNPFEKPLKIKKIQEKLEGIKKELQESELLGIINFEGERHAIIGRHTVKKGDRIFNMMVDEITSDEVVLSYNEFQFTYKMEKKDKSLIKK